MAATRSPLRIRPVPEMPSSPASRWSSGSSIPDSPLPRRRELPVFPEAAGASEVPAASWVPVTTRSVVSLTYRSFPAVTCALPAQGSPTPGGPARKRGHTRERDEIMRGGSAAKRDRLLRPRARLARVGGYAVSLDAAHGLDNTGGFQRVPRYRDDTREFPSSTRAPARSTSNGWTVQSGGATSAIDCRSVVSPAVPSPAGRCRARTSALEPAPETTAARPRARSRSTRASDPGIAAV